MKFEMWQFKIIHSFFWSKICDELQFNFDHLIYSKYSNINDILSKNIITRQFYFFKEDWKLMVVFLGLFMPNLHFIYYNVVYAEISIHLLIICICKVLHLINREMYSSLAYRVSLSRRYQVSFFIASLTFLFKKIYSFILKISKKSEKCTVLLCFGIWSRLSWQSWTRQY